MLSTITRIIVTAFLGVLHRKPDNPLLLDHPATTLAGTDADRLRDSDDIGVSIIHVVP